MNNSRNDIKLSIVVTARNDDHGGGFMHRMQVFVNGLLAQCERHKLRAELIIVEWNPPVGKPGLSQALTWPEESSYCSVRIIEVPQEIHNRYKYAHKLPLYQMIAKNVGMRRARGRFILATNIDVLFNDELMQFLANGELREGILYRIDRTDVSEDVPLQATIDEQLDYCLGNIIRINCREGTHQKLTGRYYPSYGHIDVVLTNLHFNACGDFTLMSTADWHRLNGYPEFDMYSPHLDSLMLIISYYAGIRQEILREPMRLYHLEHGGAWIAENASKLEQEKKTEKIPVLKLSDFERWTSEMNAKGEPIIFNDSRWGFASEDLRETVVIAATGHASEWPGNSVSISKCDNDKREKENNVKSILIIAENIPAFDAAPHDRLYLIIRALADTHKVTFVTRRGSEKGKYVEHLRRLGVIVFYDEDGLMEQASLNASVTSQFASSVSVKTLFAHHNFDVILLGSSEISSYYISVIRALSPQSVLIINAAESSIGVEHVSAIKLYVYDEADIVIASPVSAKILSVEFPDLNIKTLPETKDLSRFKEALFLIVDHIPEPVNKKLERFRILRESLPGAMQRLNKTEVTVIFILNNNNDTSKLPLDMLLKYSDPELSNVIVALNNKRCDGVERTLEIEARHYFKYGNKQECDKFIAGIVRHCLSEYIAIVEDSVIVSPHWDKRLAAHLKKNPGTGIVTARHSEFIYKSIYELENDAYKIYEEYRGENKLSKTITTPCFILNSSFLDKNRDQDLECILEILLNGYKTVVAQDTLVFHLRKALKERDAVSLKNDSDKKISVVIPVDNCERLLLCLNSLFIQKNIDYEDIEIVVACAEHDNGTIDMLSSAEAPCDFKYFVHGKGHAALLNKGILEARGKYILLVSPETVAHEDLISEHLKTHLKYEGRDIAVLGHTFLSDNNDSSSFMKFILKKPKLPFISPLVFDCSDMVDLNNAAHFYLSNISLKRQIFQKIGMFDEDLQNGWEDIEFGSRFALNGYNVVYDRKALVSCSYDMNFNAFIDRQISVGRQYAIMAYKHPNIWYPDKAKRECLRHFIGKERLFELVKKIVNSLEGMPEDNRNNYNFAGTLLLDKSYYLLSNYFFALGINDEICRIEDQNWLIRHAEERGIDTAEVLNQNRAYEALFEGYWHIGSGDHTLFSKCIEQSSSLLDTHPSSYYAAGTFYFNLNEYELAEATFEQGIEKRRNYNDDSIFPMEEESLYIMWLAMSCIPQGKHKKAAKALEGLIAERVSLSLRQESLIYKCLSLCYKAIGERQKADFCRKEAERLGEEIMAKEEFSRAYDLSNA